MSISVTAVVGAMGPDRLAGQFSRHSDKSSSQSVRRGQPEQLLRGTEGSGAPFVAVLREQYEPYSVVMDRDISPALEPPSNLAIGIVKALRPRQWLKNMLVVAAPLATLGGNVHYDFRDVGFKVGVAFVVFCLAASSTYLINDARDMHADRPTKRFRPIAAGVVPPSLAYGLAIGLAAASLAISVVIAPPLAVVIAVYLAIQLGYNFGLKHHAVLDICLVSSGFLIRAIAGGAATGIPLSQWFLLVMAFASLFAVRANVMQNCKSPNAPAPKSAKPWKATQAPTCGSCGLPQPLPRLCSTGCGLLSEIDTAGRGLQPR